MCDGATKNQSPVHVETAEGEVTAGLKSPSRRAIAPCPPPSADRLFDNRKRLIQQTWKFVEQDLDAQVARLFYSRLFEKYPSTKGMFEEASMEVQARKLFEVLRVAVKFVDNIDEILPSIKEMGARHARVYGVERLHYQAVTTVLVEILNEYLEERLQPIVGDSIVLWRVDVTAAWSWILTLIGTTMADAANVAEIEGA
jgi:hemoglobin-like flavoprotein